jgi:Spy/CpxP family protein refolding chaperone
MIHTKHAWTWLAILALATSAWGYKDREKDKARIQEAIEQGIIDSHPFPPVGQWGDWVNNCGDMLSYRSIAISHWQEVADATEMTAEQRAKAEALHKRFREAHEAFDETTTPPKNKLKARSEEAKKAGKDELARKLMKLVYVQAHYKLAIQGGASEDLLRLLTPEQLTAWHNYRVTKYGARTMCKSIYDRKVGGEKLSKLLAITDTQREQIDEMAWKLSKETFLPTIEHPQNISAFGVFGEDQKRARALAEEKLLPKVIQEVLTDEQREKLKKELEKEQEKEAKEEKQDKEEE